MDPSKIENGKRDLFNVYLKKYEFHFSRLHVIVRALRDKK